MNALIRKEIRLLAPAWAVALALTIPPVVYTEGVFHRSALPVFAFWLALLLLGLSSFGREFNSGCFSLLLAQPAPRKRVWWTKTLPLAAAACSVFILWALFCFKRRAGVPASNGWDKFVAGGLWGFALVTGGLWTTLLFRQVAAAFWLSLLIPAALGIAVAEMVGCLESRWPSLFPERAGAVAVVAVTILYSIAGYWWARRLFLRAQDTAWTGGDITLPKVRGLARLQSGWSARRGACPRAALLVKELQFHQAQLVVAGGLILLHLAAMALRKFGGEFTKQQVMEFILSGFWTLWLVMPLLVGCAAVAEERKLGTLEGQLCLPVKRRRQFVIKAGVVLLLSVVLGVAMPLLLEGWRILPDAHFETKRVEPFLFGYVTTSLTFSLLLADFLTLLSQWLPLIILCLIAASIGALSFFTSTLMRNPLQALGPAVLAVIATIMLLVGANQPESFFNYPLWRGWLIYLIGVPVLTLMLTGLAYWNFKRVLVGWPVWRRNILVFLGSLAFVIVTTSAVYHRAWEFLTPLEPPRGVPRLSLAQGLTLRNEFGNLVAQLPDGRIWTEAFSAPPPGLQSLAGALRDFVSTGGRFLEGSNWTSVVVSSADVVGVKRDGSLWVSAKSEELRIFRPQASQTNAEPIKLERLGNDNDWKSVAGGPRQFFLLKTDGALWHLGTNRFDGRNRWPGLRAFKPERLGTESDWAEFESSGYQTILRKLNGQAWVRGMLTSPNQEMKFFGKDVSFGRAPALDKHQWRSPVLVYGPGIADVQVGIRDGVFGVCGGFRLPKGKTSGQLEWKDANVPLGKESNWLAVAGKDQTVVTLKADGTLWKWEFLGDPITHPWTARATRLGTHSDWVGVSQDLGGIISLAADGNLWLWRFEPRRVYYSDSPQPLLAASRKPQRIASVFGDAK